MIKINTPFKTKIPKTYPDWPHVPVKPLKESTHEGMGADVHNIQAMAYRPRAASSVHVNKIQMAFSCTYKIFIRLAPCALIKFLHLESGCLFQVGGYLRLVAY